MMYSCFSCQNFEKIGIFRHSTVRLDLKDLLELIKFKDLELSELLNLAFLNIQRSKEDYEKIQN
jgi:hypothetical protein